MHLGGVTIALRRRMPWEATDLGIALVRAHGRRIFAAWCLVSVPVWVVVNALGVAINAPWVALLVMWWLKPVFDRVPLYAISRAVFGDSPGVREIVRAQLTWGWRDVLPWLLWRRPHLGRLWLLPVDLLERVKGAKRRERVRVLAKGDAGPRNQIAMLGLECELMLSIALCVVALLFVPTEFLPDATVNLFHHVFDHPPLWAKVLLNGILWTSTSIVEPFLVGAGFGLYLNRRVQLEAWDVEHAFRRMAARLARTAQAVSVVLALAVLGSHPVQAAARPECPESATAARQSVAPSRDGDVEAAVACGKSAARDAVTTSLPALFAASYRSDGGAFMTEAKRAQGSLVSTVRDYRWISRTPVHAPDSDQFGAMSAWMRSIADLIAIAASYWLWILVGLLLVFVLYHHRAWMSWLQDTAPPEAPGRIETRTLESPLELPNDVPNAVRALWQRGEQRAALALFYQAAVHRLVERLDTPLAPGATEGECLSRCRRLKDPRFVGLFARIVACWQAAAYAHRMPETDYLEILLSDWTRPGPVVA